MQFILVVDNQSSNRICMRNRIATSTEEQWKENCKPPERKGKKKECSFSKDKTDSLARRASPFCRSIKQYQQQNSQTDRKLSDGDEEIVFCLGEQERTCRQKPISSLYWLLVCSWLIACRERQVVGSEGGFVEGQRLCRGWSASGTLLNRQMFVWTPTAVIYLFEFEFRLRLFTFT